MATVGRKYWIQADLRCLLCGRTLGRLVGPLAPDAATRRLPAGGLPQFAAFRPADLAEPAVRLAGGEHFRCATCGGGVIMDELETFSTHHDADADIEDQRPRRGRRPKPRQRPVAPPSWLDELGLAG